MRLSSCLGRQPFGPKCPNIVVGNASELPFAKVLFKRIYDGDRRRRAADASDLAPVDVFSRLEVLQRSTIGFERVHRSVQKKARLGEHSLALGCSDLRRPLVSAAATSFSTASHQVTGLLAPGNGDANKLLHQRDRHSDASAVFMLEQDSAFVGLQYAAPIE